MDALPLLESSPPALGAPATAALMQALEREHEHEHERERDREQQAPAALLRLALARNLARAALAHDLDPQAV